jgi:DNA-binding MarR family transcriptional regulator
MDGADRAPVCAAELHLGALDRSLGFLLRIAQLQAFERFYAAMAAQGVRPGAFTILSVIGRNPGVRQGVLAQRLMIKRAHMAKIVRSLRDEGLVESVPAASDRRAVELTLTGAGRAHVASREAAFLGLDSGPPPGLDTAETRALVGLLRKLTGMEGEGA